MTSSLLLRWLPPQTLQEDPNRSLHFSWMERSKTTLFSWLLGRAQSCFLSLEIKGRRLVLVRPNKTIEITRGQLREATFSIGPEGDGLLLLWMRLRYEQEFQERTLQVPLWVDGLNCRQEAMDLIFRIAQAWGLVGYQLSERRRELTVSLLQEIPESAEPYRAQATVGVYRAPILQGAADYHSDDPPPKNIAQERKSFDWARLRKNVIFVLLVSLYTLLWSLAGLPGGVAVVMVLMLAGVLFDLFMFGVGGSTPFSNLMNVDVAGYSMMGILVGVGLVLGFIWSVRAAVRWVQEEH
jgi:hypothetical protein